MKLKQIFCKHDWINENCYLPKFNAYEFRSRCLKCSKVTKDKYNKKNWSTKQNKHHEEKQYIYVDGRGWVDLYIYENFNPNNPGI